MELKFLFWEILGRFKPPPASDPNIKLILHMYGTRAVGQGNKLPLDTLPVSALVSESKRNRLSFSVWFSCIRPGLYAIIR